MQDWLLAVRIAGVNRWNPGVMESGCLILLSKSLRKTGLEGFGLVSRMAGPATWHRTGKYLINYPAPIPGLMAPVQALATPGTVGWAATASGEILEIEPEKPGGEIRSIKSAAHGKFGKINDLLEDREGNVWILSYSGLFRTTGTRLNFLNKETDPALETIHALRSDVKNPDKIWFSNDQGLFSLNLSGKGIRKYLEGFKKPNLKINCLFQDHHGYIWAGTFNYGVFRIRPEDGSWIRFTEEQGLVNNNVLSISGHDDTLWMATLGGASELILQGRAASGTVQLHLSQPRKWPGEQFYLFGL